MADLTDIQASQAVKIAGANPSGIETNYVNANTNGDLQVQNNPIDGIKSTYSTAAVGFIPPASATDVFVIKGSATKTLRITNIQISMTTTAGSGALVTCSLIKRSSANTGGTTVSDVAVPHDSLDAAATGTVVHYTANPTALGTTVGTLKSARLEANNSSITPSNIIWQYGTRPSKAILLRGTSEFLAINFGTATVTGPIASIDIEWTEE